MASREVKDMYLALTDLTRAMDWATMSPDTVLHEEGGQTIGDTTYLRYPAVNGTPMLVYTGRIKEGEYRGVAEATGAVLCWFTDSTSLAEVNYVDLRTGEELLLTSTALRGLAARVRDARVVPAPKQPSFLDELVDAFMLLPELPEPEAL